jgi:peptidoglycan/LPS O-acetylase OafA/YrhL
MYVIHLPLHLYVGLPLLRRVAPDVGTVPALGYLVMESAATFAAAAISYHLFERRFLALKDRLAPR